MNVGVNEVAAPYTDAAGKTKYPYLGDNAFGYAYHVDARNAITTSTGVGSQNYIYALPMQLRNAKALGVEVVDSADNSVVYYSQYDSYIPKAAYDANQGMYLSYASYMWDGKNYSGSEPAELPNNTEVTVKINATLDCAGAADKRTEWSFPVTIDGENPVAGNVVWNYVKPQTMTLELSDNQYLMGAFVYDLDDTGAPANFYLSKTYASDAKTDKTLADTSSETVDLTGADTSKPLYIEVYDYAGNASVYEVSFVNAPSIPSNPGTTVKYTVTAAAGAGGSVSPASSSVSAGGSVTVTITPDNGYEIAKVMVDGVSVGAVSSYTFSNVDKDHILNATFRRGQTALEWVSPFVDVKSGDWFYGAVADVVSSGLMDGISASEFAPSADTSRAMVITVLYRMYGEPGVTGTTSFTDVEAGSWYEKAVVWGVQNKIVKGVSDTSFAPFASVTRQELAAFLYRYAQFTGRDTAARVDLAARFADASRVADWAADAMSWAVASGIITGTGTGLDPEGSAVRAQFAAMISRY